MIISNKIVLDNYIIVNLLNLAILTAIPTQDKIYTWSVAHLHIIRMLWVNPASSAHLVPLLVKNGEHEGSLSTEPRALFSTA